MSSSSNTSRVVFPHGRDDSGEDEPLLSSNTLVDAQHNDQHAVLPAARPLSTLILYFMAIHFLLAFAEIILVAPLIRLFENSLCLTHYGFPDGGVAEALCKIPEIQRPLATIRGWKSMFDTIPGTGSVNRAFTQC